MLLQEFNPVFKLTVISEGRGGNSKTCLRGKFQEANQLNKNKRIYSKELLERETNKLQGLIDENRLVGELDHPTYDVVKLQNASHRITKLSWEGNNLIGEMELLSTPAGKVAECLLKDGVQLGISSRALGSLSPCDENEGASKVNDDLDMRTYDLVADPSVKGAFPGLTESVQAEKKIKSAYKQVLGEKVFVSMLKESLQALIEEKNTVEEITKTSQKGKDTIAKNLIKRTSFDIEPSVHGRDEDIKKRREASKKHKIAKALNTDTSYRTTNDVRKSISEMESSEMTTDNARDLMEAYSKKKVSEGTSYRTTDDVRNLLEVNWTAIHDISPKGTKSRVADKAAARKRASEIAAARRWDQKKEAKAAADKAAAESRAAAAARYDPKQDPEHDDFDPKTWTKSGKGKNARSTEQGVQGRPRGRRAGESGAGQGGAGEGDRKSGRDLSRLATGVGLGAAAIGHARKTLGSVQRRISHHDTRQDLAK